MTPGELIREPRLRKGSASAGSHYRAGTSQSAIARIERGDEEVTWTRLESILLCDGRGARARRAAPLPSRYDAWDMLEQRRASARGAARERPRVQQVQQRARALQAGRRAQRCLSVFDPERFCACSASTAWTTSWSAGSRCRPTGTSARRRTSTSFRAPDLAESEPAGRGACRAGRPTAPALHARSTSPIRSVLKRAALVPLRHDPRAARPAQHRVHGAGCAGRYEELRERALEVRARRHARSPSAALDDLIRMKRVAGARAGPASTSGR